MESPTRRLTRSPRHAREQAVLLAAAAAVSGLTGAWLLLLPAMLPRLFGATGLVFAVLLGTRARRSWRSAAAPPAFLELTPSGLRLFEDGGDRELPWRDVSGVSVDEDRLTVTLLDRAGERLLELEPGYGDLPLHDLANIIADTHRANQAR